MVGIQSKTQNDDSNEPSTAEKQGAEEGGKKIMEKTLDPIIEETSIHSIEDSARFWQIPCDSVEIFHIIVFHLQDTHLFQIRFPGMPGSFFSLGGYIDKIISFARLDSLAFTNRFACLAQGSTPVTKLLVNISLIPFMICIFLACALFVKLSQSGHQVKKRLMSSAYQVLLLIVLFTSQQLSISALNLVNCVDLGTGDYLKIDTTVKCYQPWQWLTFAYILLFIFPLWLVLFIAPGLLRSGLISVRIFIFGLLFPGPFLLYLAGVIKKARNQGVKDCCHDIMADAILGEVCYSYKPFPGYRFLCWGGLVELRRLALVLFATLIPEYSTKIMCMIMIIILAFTIHFIFHPYSDVTANVCANVSLVATMSVGIINFGWTAILYAGSGFEYGDAWKIAQGIATLEIIFTEIVPLGMILFCFGQILWINTIDKST